MPNIVMVALKGRSALFVFLERESSFHELSFVLSPSCPAKSCRILGQRQFSILLPVGTQRFILKRLLGNYATT